MPWHCPACHTEIRHNELEPKPRERVIYRCHVCRLELVLDERSDRLTVAPIREAADDDRATR